MSTARARRPVQPALDADSDALDTVAMGTPEADDGSEEIEPGKRLIRVPTDQGVSWRERLAHSLYRWSWGTPLHASRLKGRFPLKLLGVPEDPIAGDVAVGTAIRAGKIPFRGAIQPLDTLDFAKIDQSPAFVDHLHSFAWLRDLSAAGTRQQVNPVAEKLVRKWLAAHGEKASMPSWRADTTGWRILYWSAYAPLILDTRDIVYRSSVLNGIARMARHLDQSADRVRPGLHQLVAWSGLIAASLILPGGEPRRAFAESGLHKAIDRIFLSDGGIVSRSLLDQVQALVALAMLDRVYDMRRMTPPTWLREATQRAVPPLLGVLHSDGGLASWQGATPLGEAHIRAVIDATRVRARPLRQAREWGYQRLTGGTTVATIDAAPPPVSRLTAAGCASTLAFELSDAGQRIIVSCGGAAFEGATIPSALASGLRTTAAHSTLIIADTNSTAILPDGTLGKGVSEVEVDRRDSEGGCRVEATHDGYVRHFGMKHQRMIALAAQGRELRGEDSLLPARRGAGKDHPAFAIRFHLAPGVEPTLTADALGALLRLPGGAVWQFRCSEGTLVIEDSVVVDRDGVPHAAQQIVINATTPPGGASIGWLFKRVG